MSEGHKVEAAVPLGETQYDSQEGGHQELSKVIKVKTWKQDVFS